jgi:hypothetical protein
VLSRSTTVRAALDLIAKRGRRSAAAGALNHAVESRFERADLCFHVAVRSRALSTARRFFGFGAFRLRPAHPGRCHARADAERLLLRVVFRSVVLERPLLGLRAASARASRGLTAAALLAGFALFALGFHAGFSESSFTSRRCCALEKSVSASRVV